MANIPRPETEVDIFLSVMWLYDFTGANWEVSAEVIIKNMEKKTGLCHLVSQRPSCQIR